MEDDALAAAAAIELAHSAFLVHDDIQDGSDWRRGQPTLHRRVGVPLALNAGDALAVLSLEVLRAGTGGLGRAAQSAGPRRVLLGDGRRRGQAMELGWRRDGVTHLPMTTWSWWRKTCWYTTAPLRIAR